MMFILALVAFYTATIDGSGRTGYYDCMTLKKWNVKASGVRTIKLPSGYYRAYCEMGINGGGYTFLSNSDIQRLTSKDLKFVFNKKNVLLRIAKTDGTQPYTIIEPLNKKHHLSVQVNSFKGYTVPQNKNLGPYLFLGTLPALYARNRNIQGFTSNKKKIQFRNCNQNPNSYFAFFTNPHEKPVSTYHPNLIYERQGVAVEWRKTAIRMPSTRRMPVDFFLLTELHFGGCGVYTSSDRWLANGAMATAIGLR